MVGGCALCSLPAGPSCISRSHFMEEEQRQLGSPRLSRALGRAMCWSFPKVGRPSRQAMANHPRWSLALRSLTKVGCNLMAVSAPPCMLLLSRQPCGVGWCNVSLSQLSGPFSSSQAKVLPVQAFHIRGCLSPGVAQLKRERIPVWSG